jgi:hypothetical protein
MSHKLREERRLDMPTRPDWYLGASDDENLSAGISWFTFLLAVE